AEARGIPGDELALGVHAALDVPQRGRAVVVPAVLVPPHPLDADRLSDRERADCRALAVVDVSGTAAERARALVVDDADTALVVEARALAEEDVRSGLDRGRNLRTRDAVAVLDVAVDDRAVLRHV